MGGRHGLPLISRLRRGKVKKSKKELSSVSVDFIVVYIFSILVLG